MSIMNFRVGNVPRICVECDACGVGDVIYLDQPGNKDQFMGALKFIMDNGWGECMGQHLCPECATEMDEAISEDEETEEDDEPWRKSLRN